MRKSDVITTIPMLYGSDGKRLRHRPLDNQERTCFEQVLMPSLKPADAEGYWHGVAPYMLMMVPQAYIFANSRCYWLIMDNGFVLVEMAVDAFRIGRVSSTEDIEDVLGILVYEVQDGRQDGSIKEWKTCPPTVRRTIETITAWTDQLHATMEKRTPLMSLLARSQQGDRRPPEMALGCDKEGVKGTQHIANTGLHQVVPPLSPSREGQYLTSDQIRKSINGVEFVFMAGTQRGHTTLATHSCASLRHPPGAGARGRTGDYLALAAALYW